MSLFSANPDKLKLRLLQLRWKPRHCLKCRIVSTVVVHGELVRVRLRQGYGATSADGHVLRLSNVVVHAEFIWMGPQAKGVVFFLFHVEPIGDEVAVEDIALEQEGMIGLECFDGAAERIRNAGYLGEFFGRKLVKILVERIAGVDAVLNSIESGEQQRGEGDVRIGRCIRRAEFDSLRFRIRGVSRNANRGGTIARGVGEVDWRFESWDEALVTIGGRICYAGERGRVF